MLVVLVALVALANQVLALLPQVVPSAHVAGRTEPAIVGAEIPIAGLAKEREELFLPGRPDPIVLAPTSSALYLVQRIRDEAHRFAITYHRQARGRIASELIKYGAAGALAQHEPHEQDQRVSHANQRQARRKSGMAQALVRA